LDTLLDFAVEFNPALEEHRGLCERITNYYYTERYPVIIPSNLVTDDVTKDKAAAIRFIKSLT